MNVSEVLEKMQEASQIRQYDISKELWREYDFLGKCYRIDNPKELFIGTTTHRVVDTNGLVHCCPAPGFQGCVVRWQPRNENEPVQF